MSKPSTLNSARIPFRIRDQITTRVLRYRSSSHPFDLLRSVLVCVDKAAGEDNEALNIDFRVFTTQFSTTLATMSRIDSVPWFMPQSNEFKCQCALMMVIMFHKGRPGMIDKALLDALHKFTLEMFDLYTHRTGLMDLLQGPYEGTEETQVADWERVFRVNGGEYAEVELRGEGEYGDDWDFQRTRVDCKYRIEFMLNYPRSPFDHDSLAKDISRYRL